MPIETIVVPDFGEVQDITVIDVFIKPGDVVKKEDSLISLESEKAVMDIPSPFSGTITEVRLNEGQSVNDGDVIALIDTEEEQAASRQEPQAQQPSQTEAPKPRNEEESEPETTPTTPDAAKEGPAPYSQESGAMVHATPSVRAYARELGVDLSAVTPTGPKNRILREDVAGLVKGIVQGQAPAAGPPAHRTSGLPEVALEDFSTFGEVSEVALGRIQKISGPHLHKSWLNIPHVTQFEEADITELDKFRKQLNTEYEKEGIRFSPLVFVIKAAVAVLRQFPLFNSSLVPGEKVILKNYFNIGIAVDTPQGLVVPVIRNADQKGLRDITVELAELSQAAREGKLKVTDLQGASFTISSLGSIGGTGFTPIVNAPQAAILGLARSAVKPVWNDVEFTPRLILPFSVSYDHRIIDGAEAARFCAALAKAITDLKRTLL